jgi:hypothetical protein
MVDNRPAGERGGVPSLSDRLLRRPGQNFPPRALTTVNEGVFASEDMGGGASPGRNGPGKMTLVKAMGRSRAQSPSSSGEGG